MTQLNAIWILITCTVLAVIICAPFIFIARKLRKRRKKEAPAPAQRPRRMSLAQSLLIFVMVAAMFLGLAQQYVAPDGWLGARLQTREGHFWFALLTTLIAGAVDYAWRSFKRRKSDGGRHP